MAAAMLAPVSCSPAAISASSNPARLDKNNCFPVGLSSVSLSLGAPSRAIFRARLSASNFFFHSWNTSTVTACPAWRLRILSSSSGSTSELIFSESAADIIAAFSSFFFFSMSFCCIRRIISAYIDPSCPATLLSISHSRTTSAIVYIDGIPKFSNAVAFISSMSSSLCFDPKPFFISTLISGTSLGYSGGMLHTRSIAT
mmetsp:Transcript_11721/g.17759  ORF Transcript_11721/g.17759 Transcript_11721/m.17759 type:complete len:200 (+) Transcript_11721:200-799(+)